LIIIECVRVLLSLGEIKEANAIAQRLTEFDSKELNVIGLLLCANIAIRTGSATSARALLDRAVSLFSTSTFLPFSLGYHQTQVLCKLLVGKPDNAREIIQRVVDHPDYSRDVSWQALMLNLRALIELHAGNIPTAITHLRASIKVSEAVGSKRIRVHERRMMGEAVYLQGNYVEAAAQFKQARSISLEMGVPEQYAVKMAPGGWLDDPRFVAWDLLTQKRPPFAEEYNLFYA
jgi:ATP/maltotriose-dependent transcriptional regulator MalT